MLKISLSTLIIERSHKFNLGTLFLLFLLLNLTLFSILGIKVVDDSPRFLNYAQKIRESGFSFDPHEFWYITYVYFLVIVKSIYDSFQAVVIGQYILSLVGLTSLYLAAYTIFEDKLVAFATGLIYVAFFKTSLFNSYILTESLYLSLTCISLFFLSKWYKKDFSMISIGFGIFFILATFLVKPTGIGLLGAFLGTVSFILFSRLKSRPYRVLVGLFILIPFMLLVNKMIATFSFFNEYIRGDLIFGMFQYKSYEYYHLLTVERPESLIIPDAEKAPLIRLILFIIYNPVYWMKLFIGKLFYFFAHIRPFWSIGHNLFSVFFLIPVYIFAFKELRYGGLELPLKIFSFLYIGIHALSVGLMTDDWDGRFLLPVIPVVFILAGNGMLALKKNYI